MRDGAVCCQYSSRIKKTRRETLKSCANVEPRICSSPVLASRRNTQSHTNTHKRTACTPCPNSRHSRDYTKLFWATMGSKESSTPSHSAPPVRYREGGAEPFGLPGGVAARRCHPGRAGANFVHREGGASGGAQARSRGDQDRLATRECRGRCVKKINDRHFFYLCRDLPFFFL